MNGLIDLTKLTTPTLIQMRDELERDVSDRAMRLVEYEIEIFKRPITQDKENNDGFRS